MKLNDIKWIKLGQQKGLVEDKQMSFDIISSMQGFSPSQYDKWLMFGLRDWQVP